ncbi:MAG: hypothetical protein ACTSRC_18155 [Candidatus Helarchaeota archaeon]
MTQDSSSPPEINYSEIHCIILAADNPFKNAIVENPRQEIIDVESINAELTTLILKSLERIRAKKNRTDLILIQGEPGLGKTHFLSRMRKKAKSNNFLFVDLPPLGDISRIYSHIFQQLFINLNWKAPQDPYTPLMGLIGRLLSHFLSEFYAQKKMDMKSQTKQILTALQEDYTKVFQYLKVLEKHQETRERIVHQAILSIITHHPEADQLFLEILFKLLDPDLQFYALKWLKGYDLSESDLNQLNVRESIDNDEIANRVLNSLLAITDRPVLFCLDQLESFSVRFEAEEGIKILFDTLTNMYNRYQNLCILLMCQSHVWTEIEKQVERSALDRIQIKKALAKLSFEEGILLTESRLRLIYPRNLKLPYGTYPFTHDFIRSILKETGYNPRRLLNRLSREIEYFKGSQSVSERFAELPAEKAVPEPPATPKTPLPAFLDQELATLQRAIEQDHHTFYTFPVLQDFTRGIVNELFRELKTQQIKLNDVLIKDIRINQKTTKKDIDITLTVEIASDRFDIGLEVNNSENMTSLYHTLRRLVHETQAGTLKYVFLLRDNSLPISPTAKRTQAYLLELQKAGAFIPLSDSDTTQLMSIKKLVEKASAGDLMQDDHPITRKEVLEYILPEKLRTISCITQLCEFLREGKLSVQAISMDTRSDEPVQEQMSPPESSQKAPTQDHTPHPVQVTTPLTPQSTMDELEDLFTDSSGAPLFPPSINAPSQEPSPLAGPPDRIQEVNLKGSILQLIQKQNFYTLKKLEDTFQNLDKIQIQELLHQMAQEQMIIIIYDRGDDFLFAVHPDFMSS